MRITIQVTCDNDEEAKMAIERLTRKHSTWEEQVEIKKPVSETRFTNVPSASSAIVRPNVSPGEPSIGKIGKETARTLLDSLPTQPAAKWSEHMKLLWKRGEVKYDGKEYWTEHE